MFYVISFSFFTVQAQKKSLNTNLNADKIVDTYLENIGGSDNWKALTSIRMEAKMSQMGIEFTGVIITAPPNKQRIEVNLYGKQTIQAYDGKTAWSINPFMAVKDAQPMDAEMAEGFANEKFENKFIDYKEKGHNIEYIGDVEIDGVMCHELKLTIKDGKEELYYFDTEYMFPIMMKTFVSTDETQEQTVKTYMSDYEEVDQLVMPKIIENRINGTTQFKLTVTKVELNIEFEDKLFDYPKATEEDKK